MRNELAKDIMELMHQYLNEDPDSGYDSEYVGIVENNNDPEKMGRCQIRIHGIHDNILTGNLQWMQPDFPLSLGYHGSFIVPEIGTSVIVKFIDGDIYQARYCGKALDKHSGTFTRSLKDENYPDSCILYETERGDFLKINRLKGEFHLRTASGCSLIMSQNGDIDITNEGTSKGDMNITLRGDFKVDNRSGNTTLVTNDCSVSAFGAVNIASNKSLTVETLDDQTFRTNANFDIVTGERMTVKSKDGIRTETSTHEMRGDTFTIAPETISNFSFSIAGNELTVPTLTVLPSPLGGPFNCIPFDPLTGQPHQGRVVTGASIAPASLEIADEILKKTAQIQAKYAALIKQSTFNITKKYASIGAQAKMTVASLNSTVITDTKTSEITSATSALLSKQAAEIKQLTDDYMSFLTTPVFDSEKTKHGEYELLIDADTTTAVLLEDLTGNMIPQDVIGCGDGLVNDDRFEDII